MNYQDSFKIYVNKFLLFLIITMSSAYHQPIWSWQKCWILVFFKCSKQRKKWKLMLNIQHSNFIIAKSTYEIARTISQQLDLTQSFNIGTIYLRRRGLKMAKFGPIVNIVLEWYLYRQLSRHFFEYQILSSSDCLRSISRFVKPPVLLHWWKVLVCYLHYPCPHNYKHPHLLDKKCT